MNKFYPNGTIIKIKSKLGDESTQVMIIGRLYNHEKVEGVIDYMGLVHPYGFQSMENIIYFQEENIDEVIFLGYEDFFEMEFKDLLKVKQEEMK